MHELELNKHTYYLPEKWEELTPEQFTALVDILHKYKTGELDYFEAKVLFVMKILGIQPRRIRSAEKRQLRDENLFRMSEKADFFFQVVYTNQKKFRKFSQKTQDILKRTLPDDIEEPTAEIRLAKKMDKYFDVDAVFLKNLLPEIKMGRQQFTGYSIDITEGVATTTLSAIQFADALTVSDKIIEGSQDLMPLLVGILYQREKYSDILARERSQKFSQLDQNTLRAVFLNFVAVREYLIRRTRYKILFSTDTRKKKKKDKYNNGLVDSIDTLVKLGYGNSEEMENKNLFRFLDTIIKSMRDSIREALKQKDVKKSDVAKEMGISIEIINELE